MARRIIVFEFSVLAILLAAAAFAQAPAPTVVRWQQGASSSDRLVRNGIEILILRQDRLIVTASFGQYSHWQMAEVGVRNGTGQRVEVVPSRITLQLVKPELVKPAQSWLIYQDPETVGSAIRHVSGWAYVAAAMAGMGTQQSRTTGRVGGVPVNTTTTTRDQAAEDRAIEAINREEERKENSAAKIENNYLRENTVLPGEFVSGFIFFALPKHFKGFKDTTAPAEADLGVPVGEYVFEFPFGRPVRSIWQNYEEPGPRQ